MDFAQMLIDSTRAHAAAVKAGIEVGQRDAQPAIHALCTVVAAYDMVKDNHPLPTVLVAACEQAKRVIG